MLAQRSRTGVDEADTGLRLSSKKSVASVATSAPSSDGQSTLSKKYNSFRNHITLFILNPGTDNEICGLV